MMVLGRTLLISALFACFVPLAFADGGDYASPAQDPARPAIGEWVGNVSWNDHAAVGYGWTLYPDGTFTSGRLGRGDNGGGEWSTRGAHLTLKYSDRFRYEGELRDDTYSGTAYTAEGRAYGGFNMSRAVKAPDASSEEGD